MFVTNHILLQLFLYTEYVIVKQLTTSTSDHVKYTHDPNPWDFYIDKFKPHESW